MTLTPTTWNAFNYLTRFDTSRYLSSAWLKEIQTHNQGANQIEQEYIFRLLTALHTLFQKLSQEQSHSDMDIIELRALVEQTGDSIWHDVLSQLNTLEIPLRDVTRLCISLREIILKSLEDANLLELQQYQFIVMIFDGVLEQIHNIWDIAQNTGSTIATPQPSDGEVLWTIAESVRSPVDLNPVLQTIVERVRESGLWPMCAIGIIDADDQEIRVPAQSGFADSYPANIKFPADGSATLEAIHRKHPIAISDVYADHEFPVLPEAAKAAGYRSILLIPLFAAEMRAAVAFCTQAPHQFKENEVALANAIAQQVMIAIENAYGHQRQKQRVDELESLNHLIAEQYALLQRAVTTHTALTRLVLDEAGLSRILEAVREVIRNPVAIEDEHFHLLIFSEDWEHFDQHRLDSIAAGGTTPVVFDNPEAARIIDDLKSKRRALLIPVMPAIGIEKRRIVAPIVAGAEILGYVWVMEALHPFNQQQDLITTEQAALVIALEMMKQRASYETELRLKANFLGDLFSESTLRESDLLRRAGFLGFNFNQSALALVVDIGQDILDVIGLQAQNRQIISRIQDAVTRLTQENLVANQYGRIIVIVPASISGSDPAQTASKLDVIIRNEIKQINANLNVLIGIGDVFRNISGVRYSALQAIRALEAARSLGRSDEMVSLRDLGIYGILFHEGESSALLNFAKTSLAPLIEYDKRNGTELLKTLDAYLLNQSKSAETARQLYIHVNTLRQRLERIESVLEASLEDPHVILNLQLALRVYEFSPEKHKID